MPLLDFYYEKIATEKEINANVKGLENPEPTKKRAMSLDGL